MKVDSLTYYPNGNVRRNLETRIANYEDSVHAHETSITRYQVSIKEVRDRINILNEAEIHLNGVNDDFVAQVNPLIESQLTNLRQRRTECLHYLANTEHYLNNSKSELVKAKQELALLGDDDGSITLKTEELRKLFKKYKFVSNVSLHDTPRGPELYWRFQPGLKATVDNNHYNWINGGGPVSYPLPGVSCLINLQTGDLKLKPLNDSPMSAFYYFQSELKTVHPHVLGRHRPCLGDFAGQIRESCEAGDVVSIIAITELFLQQINASDEAGQTWVKRFGISRHADKDYCHLRYDEALGKDIYKNITIDPNTGEVANELYVWDGDNEKDIPLQEYLAQIVTTDPELAA